MSYAIGPDCGSRTNLDINEGDHLRISFKVRSPEAGAILKVWTRHKSTEKKNWAIPQDDSHIVARSKIFNANEWTPIEVAYLVNPGWTYKDTNGDLIVSPP